jgi:hypothetical protein
LQFVVSSAIKDILRLLQMAVAEPASQVTFKTIGGILLAAFFAASVGFYVHTTKASSEDSPQDMQPGFVYKVRTKCPKRSALESRRSNALFHAVIIRNDFDESRW